MPLPPTFHLSYHSTFLLAHVSTISSTVNAAYTLSFLTTNVATNRPTDETTACAANYGAFPATISFPLQTAFLSSK
jgi:hypothetical protein